MGRFITPDWAAKPAAVPYAVLGDPQSLNLYTYVRNIPTTNIDQDGHFVLQQQQKEIDQVVNNFYEKHPWAKSWDQFLEKVDNVASGHGWKTDAQMADQDTQDRADFAKAYPGMPYSELKIGIVSPEGLGSASRATEAGEALSRLGTSTESATRLGRKAAEAEASKIGIHGVSATAAKVEGAASQASRASIEGSFKVHNTPTTADPLHRTIELPKPVTKFVADLFNALFGR